MEHHFRLHMDLFRQSQVISHATPTWCLTDASIYQHQLNSLYHFSSCFSLLSVTHAEGWFSLVAWNASDLEWNTLVFVRAQHTHQRLSHDWSNKCQRLADEGFFWHWSPLSKMDVYASAPMRCVWPDPFQVVCSANHWKLRRTPQHFIMESLRSR